MTGVGENQLISIQPDELKFLCKNSSLIHGKDRAMHCLIYT